MRKEIFRVSHLLKGRTRVTSGDYQEILDSVTGKDLVYMDPPYQGTSGGKDPRYYSSLGRDELVDFLHTLNRRQVMYMLSYDGRRGSRTYGKQLPGSLNLRRLEINAGRSTQSTLLGSKDVTYESLYISPALATHLNYPISETRNGPGVPGISLFPTQLKLGPV